MVTERPEPSDSESGCPDAPPRDHEVLQTVAGLQSQESGFKARTLLTMNFVFFSPQVELVYHFESVYARKEISVVYRTKSRNCSGKYTVEGRGQK